MVYGDYDVDGTSSVALMSLYLRDKIAELLPYIPDRYSEGYGISEKGIEKAKAEGISLIISLDCGIKAIKQVNYAKEMGIDFIICDHHLPDNKIPKAVAVLDPKREDCSYPFKELCGCGIGFKLIQALQTQFGLPDSELSSYLDLVAIAVAADIVPMTGENRILTFLGIRQFQEYPRPGLNFFLKTLKRPLNVTDLVFVIAPRINAAGRMDHGLNAVELLMDTDKESVLPIARSIEFFNTERKTTDERITNEALQQIKLNNELNYASTVVYHPSWHKGVIGIVASRLIEHYYRPTVVLTKSEDVIAGSVRSVSGFDVYQALEACKDSIIQFGGHKYAAGLTLNPEQIDLFRSAFEAYTKESILPDQREPSISYDLEISFKDLNFKLLRILNQMAPFGPKNMRPIFATHQCKDAGGSRLVGSNKKHLRFDIIDSFGDRFSGIGFDMGQYIMEIKKQKPFSILYNIEENQYNGNTSLQLKVKNIKF
jgi:single-stranded-DNA-specific exonuclease